MKNSTSAISAKHFTTGLDGDAARRLFKASVMLISIETFSYCNRKCWFCANSFLDRYTENLVIDDQIFDMITRDLGSIDYRGTVNLSGYNEPLATPQIVEHIRRVRRDVPKAVISTYSNGDYLTRSFLEELYDAGLNELYLSIHTGNQEHLNDKKVERRLKYYREKCGLDVKMKTVKRGIKYKGRITFRDMFIQLYEPNMRTEGSNMGELIKDVERRYHRTCPCLEPLKHFTVEFNGNVVPCCRIRTDADAHKFFAFCNLSQVSSIFEAYTGASGVEWRRGVSTFGEKQSPCGSCDNALVKDNWLTRFSFTKVEKMIAKSILNADIPT